MKETYSEERKIICVSCNAYNCLTPLKVNCATPPKLEDGTICPCYQCLVKTMCNSDCEIWIKYYDFFKEKYGMEHEIDSQERNESMRNMFYKKHN